MKEKSVLTKATANVVPAKCQHALAAHDHLHAANCGHKSYVHAGHVCYEHEGHFHYMHDGHAHDCAGPFVQQTVRPVSKTLGAPAKVIPIQSAKKKAAK